jgi:hypothetical protein
LSNRRIDFLFHPGVYKGEEEKACHPKRTIAF